MTGVILQISTSNGGVPKRAIDRGIVWGERRKAAATEAAAPINSIGFDGSGSQYNIDQIDRMVREGAPAHGNRSDIFH